MCYGHSDSTSPLCPVEGSPHLPVFMILFNADWRPATDSHYRILVYLASPTEHWSQKPCHVLSRQNQHVQQDRLQLSHAPALLAMLLISMRQKSLSVGMSHEMAAVRSDLQVISSHVRNHHLTHSLSVGHQHPKSKFNIILCMFDKQHNLVKDSFPSNMHAVIQELSKEMADYKSQAQASAPRVWFGPTQQQPTQQREQQQQPPFGSQPVLMWDQSMTPGNGRQSVSWGTPQTAGGQPGEGPMTAQLLQKLQKTQQKLEARDASARKYKVQATMRALIPCNC